MVLTTVILYLMIMFDYRNRYFVEIVTETIWQYLYFFACIIKISIILNDKETVTDNCMDAL